VWLSVPVISLLPRHQNLEPLSLFSIGDIQSHVLKEVDKDRTLFA
jgi:hypothetical protein